MKKNTVQDERILQERRKIQSKAYAFIQLVLLASVVVQQFFMRAPFAQYAVEFFVLIGSGLYNLIANYKRGIDLWNTADNSRKKLAWNTLVTGIVSAVLLALFSGVYDIKNLASYFVAFVIFFYVSHSAMAFINHRKQQALERQLDEEEKDL